MHLLPVAGQLSLLRHPRPATGCAKHVGTVGTLHLDHRRRLLLLHSLAAGRVVIRVRACPGTHVHMLMHAYANKHVHAQIHKTKCKYSV